MMPSIYPVACHTDNVGAGTTFVAIKGMSSDGTCYIPEALAKGASRIVVQQDAVLADDIVAQIRCYNAVVEYVPNTRQALAQLSAQAAGYPAQKLNIIGITGTKGKSTCTFLVAHILRSAGKKVALLSTVHNQINNQVLSAPLTTAQPDYLHQFFAVCVQEGIEWVIMETAAQAFSLHRVDTIQFAGILFTNFAQEHLEFYQDMDDYFAAKCQIFSHLLAHAPVIMNADDIWLQRYMHANCLSATTFGINQAADVRAYAIQQDSKEITFTITSNAGTIPVRNAQLLGVFNVYNSIAAVALTLQLSIPLSTIVNALGSFSGVRGRLEKYMLPNGATCFLDYAHNPSSFENLFSLLRQLTPHLIVLFGAGGKRDATKRPLMGAIAAAYADVVILTTDNPRTEDPHSIMNDILQGITSESRHKVIIEYDRELAIKKAYSLSRSDSIIALLGKGPDEYQIFGTVKIPFYERLIVQSL
jgi:UDP-N-acetylmuramoyl-L-alanyl-D-glutamate--2,6-diaminopimelate ligase